MTVTELIAELSKLPGDWTVVLNTDGEGWEYAPVRSVEAGSYDPIVQGFEAKGETDESTFNAVCLWETGHIIA